MISLFNNRLLGLLGVLLIAILAASCDLLEPVEEPEFDNPRDPQSGSANPPKVNIIDFASGPTHTILDHTLNIEWEPDTSGITDSLEYQYRFAEIGENIDEKSFSQWVSNTTLTFEYLDESINGGVYVFQVKARSSNNSELEQQEPTELRFRVDAVDEGPLFYPRRLSPNDDGTFSTEVYLNEIEEASEVAAIQLQIRYPGSSLTVESVDIYDENSVLSQANGEIVGFDDYPSSGELLLNLGVLGGDVSQITGTGPVAKVTFSSNSADRSEIYFDSQTKFLKEDESQISIDRSDSALLPN